MPALQKYDERVTTAVSLERKLHKVCKALAINFSDALSAGISFYVRMRIADKDPRLTAELLQDFRDIESRNIKELEGYIRLKQEEQRTIELVSESLKPDELIEVWDKNEESYITIPRSKYDACPDFYIIRTPREAEA